jgi:hypothetical protein
MVNVIGEALCEPFNVNQTRMTRFCLPVDRQGSVPARSGNTTDNGQSTIDSKFMNEGLFILGTGLLAEEIFAVATHMGLHVAGFIENLDPRKDGTSLCDRPVLWVDRSPQGAGCVCGLATTKRRLSSNR